MHRCDARQTLIIRVQGGCHRGEARHEAIYRWLAVISALQQPLDFSALAHHKASAASLDQRRVAQQQAIVGASEPKILGPSLAKAPDLIHCGFVS